jgi:hypothetical protein
MQFKNITGKTLTVKIGKTMVTIRPSETAELTTLFNNDSRFQNLDKKEEVDANLDVNKDGKVDGKDLNIVSNAVKKQRKKTK